MKKLTLLAVVLVTISSGLLKAQTNQGKVLLGLSSTLSLDGTGYNLTGGTGFNLMNISFSSTKYKSDAYEEGNPHKKTNINLSPKVGYFVVDNLVIGLDLNVASLSEKGGTLKISQTLLSTGPFIRYYLPTSNVRPFFEFNSAFGVINNKLKTDIYEEFKSSVKSIGGGFGIAAPLGERVMFDVLAGYNSLTVQRKENNDNNFRNVIGTLGLKFGFTMLLGAN